MVDFIRQSAELELKAKMKATMRAIKYKLLYRAVVLVIELSNEMPRRVWIAFCAGLGNLLYYAVPGIKRQIQKNLTLAYKSEKSVREIRMLTKQD